MGDKKRIQKNEKRRAAQERRITSIMTVPSTSFLGLGGSWKFIVRSGPAQSSSPGNPFGLSSWQGMPPDEG